MSLKAVIREQRAQRPADTGAANETNPYPRWKRGLDLTLIFLTAPLWIPVLALCALAVKAEDPRSRVLFSQDRTGLLGVRFPMLKLRTMVAGAEELRPRLQSHSERPWPAFKMARDPRVTRVGRVLRPANLDELPQLLNVIAGHMSLVGPRPTSWPIDCYDEWHTSRLVVVPGITGLWQVTARETGGHGDFDSWVLLDEEYILRRSLRLDLSILGRTFLAALPFRQGRRRSGAASGTSAPRRRGREAHAGRLHEQAPTEPAPGTRRGSRGSESLTQGSQLR